MRWTPAGTFVALAVVALVLAAVLRPLWSPEQAPQRDRSEPLRAAEEFLDTYVATDGRVVRHDQGGDTVSEGQAYAMLLAAGLRNRERFRTVWWWTRTNLQRPDGLLSWHWADGEVVDPESAADADLDAARALLLAAEKFGEPSYLRDARRLAEAIMANERVSVDGRALVVAGPWGRPAPHVFNPSYFSPRAHALLGAATDDERWSTSRHLGYELIEQLRGEQGPLPPDWSKVSPEGDAWAVPAPRTYEGVRYSYDAMRLPLRLAQDCSERGRDLAAGLWPFFRGRRDDPIAPAYTLDGRRMAPGEHPGAVVAAAASAHAAAEEEAAADLLDRAESLQEEHPTYYGGALLALGRMALQTSRLGSCSEAEGDA
ncbi:MAG: glycosyl hydrolase family 8 [Actinomycetota bacterium]